MIVDSSTGMSRGTEMRNSVGCIMSYQTGGTRERGRILAIGVLPVILRSFKFIL
jgi:hypothetical protein